MDFLFTASVSTVLIHGKSLEALLNIHLPLNEELLQWESIIEC